MKSRRRASSSGDPNVLSERMRRSSSPSWPCAPCTASGVLRNVETSTTFPPFEEDVREPEAPPDDARVAEQAADFLGTRVGSDVEVLRRAARHEVAHRPSDEIRLEAGAVQPVQDAQGVGIDVAARYRMLGARQDAGNAHPAGCRIDIEPHCNCFGAARKMKHSDGVEALRPGRRPAPRAAARTRRARRGRRRRFPVLRAREFAGRDRRSRLRGRGDALRPVRPVAAGARVPRVDPARPRPAAVLRHAVQRARDRVHAARRLQRSSALRLGAARRGRVGGARGRRLRVRAAGRLGERGTRVLRHARHGSLSRRARVSRDRRGEALAEPDALARPGRRPARPAPRARGRAPRGRGLRRPAASPPRLLPDPPPLRRRGSWPGANGPTPRGRSACPLSPARRRGSSGCSPRRAARRGSSRRCPSAPGSARTRSRPAPSARSWTPSSCGTSCRWRRALVVLAVAAAGLFALALRRRRGFFDLVLVLAPAFFSLWFLHSRAMSRYSVPFVLVLGLAVGSGARGAPPAGRPGVRRGLPRRPLPGARGVARGARERARGDAADRRPALARALGPSRPRDDRGRSRLSRVSEDRALGAPARRVGLPGRGARAGAAPDEQAARPPRGLHGRAGCADPGRSALALLHEGRTRGRGARERAASHGRRARPRAAALRPGIRREGVRARRALVSLGGPRRPPVRSGRSEARCAPCCRASDPRTSARRPCA